MIKKVLALFLALAVCSVLFLCLNTSATATESKYSVGYARVDINPYNVDGDPSSGIMQLPLRGSGDVWNRLSHKGLVDDNGDGVIDENDGLKVTCVAVTDSDGTTILMISIDLIGGSMYSKAAKLICSRVNEAVSSGELSNVSLSEDQIFVVGTHTHNAPDITVYTSKGKTGTNNDGVDLSVINENLGIWIDRTAEDIVDSAILALKDRAPATMAKDQLSASEVQSDAVAGKTMCTTRHYVNSSDGSVAGDNFNSRGTDPKQVTEVDDNMYLLNFTFDDADKLPVSLVSWHGHPSLNNSDTYENGGRHCLSSDYVNSFRHALEYGVDVTVNKDDALGYVETWSYGAQQKYRVAFFQSTGGNVNPRGQELVRDEAGNVLTYFDGTKNVNMYAYSWVDVSGKKATVNGNLMGRACSYGVVLADMAEEALTDGRNVTNVSAGKIQYLKSTLTADRKTEGVTQVSYNAAKAYQQAASLQSAAAAKYTPAKSAYDAYVTAYEAYLAAQKKVDDAGSLGFLYQSNLNAAIKKRDAAKTTYDSAMAAYTPLLDAYVSFMETNTKNKAVTVVADKSYAVSPDKTVLSLPFVYQNADGETFAIGSKYHANAIIADWSVTLSAPHLIRKSITVKAFMLGEEVAFVTLPGEPFDYYYKVPGVYTPENNLWNDLIRDSYGKPFVLGYCNGASGYFPNYEAYVYNQDMENKTTGSYEVHISDFAQGTGERIIGYLNQMLTAMDSDVRESYCEHCKAVVAWQPYAGETAINTDGHYYLCSDYSGPQITVGKNATASVCFDLNGYTVTGDSRAFYVYGAHQSTLSVMDSSEAQTGVAQGYGCEYGAGVGYGGGSLIVEGKAVFNLYGGTLQRVEKENYSVVTGGVVRMNGTMNMYGGRILGSFAASFEGTYISNKKAVAPSTPKIAMGGAVLLNGTLNMYGGEISDGRLYMITGTAADDGAGNYTYSQTVEPLDAGGTCVYVSAGNAVNLYGDAKIANLFFAEGNQQQLTIHGKYTGSVEITYPTETQLELYTAVGKALPAEDGTKASVSQSAISFEALPELTAAVKEGAIVVSESSDTYAYCEGCKTIVQWTEVEDGDFLGLEKKMVAGHYMLTEDVYNQQLQLNLNKETESNTYCFDLSGYRLTGTNSRAIYAYPGTTLNIMDSVGTGSVLGGRSTARGGGTIISYYGSVVNLYGGTLLACDGVSSGGVIQATGEFNVYGGVIQGGQVNASGAAVYVKKESGKDVAGSLNIYGGVIKAGKAGTVGDCVYIDAATVTLSGSAEVDEVRYKSASADTFVVDATDVPFTGSVVLRYASEPAIGADIGNYIGEKGMDTGSVMLVYGNLFGKSNGTDIVVCEAVARMLENGKVAASFDTLSDAVAAYTYQTEDSNAIRLVASISENVAVDKDVYLDLNGYDVTGKIAVQSGATLYCMDSQTDDYTVSDGVYGKLKGDISGVVAGVPVSTVGAEESAQDSHRAGYLKVTESDGISFHRVNMNITSMSLRTSCVGVYYRSNFIGDEVVADKVQSYGIVFSIAGEPTAQTMDTTSAFSAYKSFAAGADGNLGANSGVLLQNIMKETLDAQANEERANMLVYGRSYILTEDGYLFGNTVQRTLKEQVVAIDGIYDQLSDTQRDKLLEMYAMYENVMSNWDIPNIIGDYQG